MKHKTFKRIGISVVTTLLVLSMSLAICISTFKETASATSDSSSFISQIKQELNTNKEKYYDTSKVYQLPSTVKDTDEISLIVEVKQDTLLDTYKTLSTNMSFSEYAVTDEANAIRNNITKLKNELLNDLDNTDINYTTGASYSAIISAFEIKIQASDFEETCTLFGERANVIVSETYNAAETQIVENNVNVFDTGIFDTTNFKYDGTGMVVAVLDTGLDYSHTAFSLANFTANRSQLGLTKDKVAALLASHDFASERLFDGLTVDDVYYNEKVPYQFDYADYDSDVMPVKSNHGTHVSGIIAGKDDTITGVAPNAQLVEMKIFSDTYDTAISSWILTALEDCVYLGVDVINMSIGTSCGYSREKDADAMSGVYDKIRDAGISLVVAASNSYNSTYGSEKNGNLGLTSNPDSATVGSPSTYESALSVASISGTKTPYFLYNGTIMYFLEANDKVSKEKSFLDDILPDGVDEMEFEYVTIPGVGRASDYSGLDMSGKIALVKRGDTTFEEKANAAQKAGAAGIIIYNNVSGEIKLSVGDATLAVCSMSQDDGELLASAQTGKIKISRNQMSGPFMSDYSSWGPTPDLKIKPEITAHGGSILSSVQGNAYERMSGTSMASPNMAGAVTLLRQYVINKFPSISENKTAVASTVNRLFMSTADIVMNTNGLPYSVRKQGAGLASLDNAAKSNAYIITYDENGNAMDKSKIELGDDPNKTGVYTLKFSVYNFGSDTLTYDIYAYVMTEGVSDTETSHGDTTVTEKAYIIDGAKIAISSNAVSNGNLLTVGAGQTADVTVTITLSDADKTYLDDSFANGMYVEGFICLDAKEENSVDLSVPYLAFYGDWTVAPLFDIDYFETSKDELDDSISTLDKTLADAYASRPIGGLSGDYISYLGSYYFQQNPSATPISADRKYISISNQEDTVSSLRFLWMGMLRNAGKIDITITDDTTGEVVFERTEDQIRKSYGDGGSIYPASVEIEFDAVKENLKNNTSYTVRVQGYLDDGNDDYNDGGNGLETNLNNVFEFPLVADFEAPAVTGCEFYTEYDKTAKKNRLYAKIAVYDNHYAMSMQVGYIRNDSTEGLILESFDEYLTPIYSEANSTSYVVYELTDYINEIKKSYNKNSFTVACYDYALNLASYEIALPDDFIDLYFEEEEVVLSPNEVYDLNPLIYPNTEWPELLEYQVSQPSSRVGAAVINNKLIAYNPGTYIVTATSPSDSTKIASFKLTVLGENDPGYIKYDKVVTDNFYLTGYYVNKAFYILDSSEREIGTDGEDMIFAGSSYSLKMYPSESITLKYRLDAYYPDNTEVVFTSSNDSIVTVSDDGTIVAIAEGYASIAVNVMLDGESTYYSQSVSIEVQNPFINSGPYLSHYYGNGGTVEFPDDLSITAINAFAFSNYNYVAKDTSAGDVINEDFPDTTKQWFIGDTTIEKVIIPYGVESIGNYAFAGLTSLKEVVFPSTLTTIDQGAFYGCTSLKTISFMDENGNITTGNGLRAVKLINQDAFLNTALTGSYTFDSIVSISNSAFKGNTKLSEITLGEYAVSVGSNAFSGNTSLKSVTIKSDKIKLGAYAFSDCTSLTSMSFDADVIPTGLFSGATNLTTVNLGASVSTIREYAFAGTKVNNITVDSANTSIKVRNNYLVNSTGDTLILAFPSVKGDFSLTDSKITKIGAGAFSGNTNITSISAPYIKNVDKYAFSGCTKLKSVKTGTLEEIGDYSFYNTALTAIPSLGKISNIGSYAFVGTRISNLNIPDNMNIGSYAFAECMSLTNITIGNNVTIGDYAFSMSVTGKYSVEKGDDGYYRYTFASPIHSLTIGTNANVGAHAFDGAHELETVILGAGASIGNYAFYNNSSLRRIDLSKAIAIGEYAFSGDAYYVYTDSSCTTPLVSEDRMSYIFAYYSAKLETVDLSSIKTEFDEIDEDTEEPIYKNFGANAFSGCKNLTSVILGENVKHIPPRAFILCSNLETINLENVETIATNAFSKSGITSADLSSAQEIGSYAFSYCDSLTNVKFNTNGVSIDEGAFAYASNLNNVSGMNNVKLFGDHAFAYNAITEADLTGATELGSEVFIKEEATNFNVIFGTNITVLGDNPFAHCVIKPFSTTETITFNGINYDVPSYTFDINDKVKVIDGSLYYTVPNGLELITFAGNTETVHVAENTVRISAYAFASSNVKNVILPYTVKAIGHKAFYDCDNLNMITFSSYNAPILEEEYDYSYYVTYNNIPATGEFGFTDVDGSDIYKDGLGIIPYYMWNVAGMPSNMYYGANFVDYIGHTENHNNMGHLIMIRPSNGQNYETFILGQYFDKIVDGMLAADDATLAVINAINALPSNVSLNDKALVENARALYDNIATIEQQALVTNLSILTNAERRISDLEYLANQENTTPETPTETPSEDSTEEATGDVNSNRGSTSKTVIIVSVSATVAVIIILIILALINKNKKNTPPTNNASDGEENGDSIDESTDNNDTSAENAEVSEEQQTNAGENTNEENN